MNASALSLTEYSERGPPLPHRAGTNPDYPVSSPVLTRLAVVLTLIVCATSASAQAVDSRRTAQIKQVGPACQAETERFCNWSETGVVEPRDAFICLRVYKTSLSPGCRRAITAVTR